MTLSRRSLILAAGTAALASAADDAAAVPARVESGERHARRADAVVHTLNGWTLPHTLKNGVKEFHLVAEEVDHEFAPGCKARCWGYNGGTPGPTIEAVEGDRVRILVTNRLPEPTSIHWHGILLPSGMDGVSGLSQPAIGPGETFAYEFTLRQHGTHMYHPHADEMVQMAVGMMGLFVIHPAGGEILRSCCTTGRCTLVPIVPIRRSWSSLTCGPSTVRCFQRSSRWWRALGNGCASVSETFRCGTTLSTCMATIST
jgi:FtsP/CotA-like multicopper oxidase with cupredoxin domain